MSGRSIVLESWVTLGLFVVTMAGFLPRHLMNVFGGE